MIRSSTAALGLLLASPIWANDYPTADRVEYVLECLYDHGGKQEYVYKCSCAIDEVAKVLPYDEYLEVSTAARYQTLGGDRGGEFRDPEAVKDAVKKYRELQTQSKQQCGIK